MGGMSSSAKAEVARVVAEAIADVPGRTGLTLAPRRCARRYGGISDMTLWRWLTDEQLGFPRAGRHPVSSPLAPGGFGPLGRRATHVAAA